MKMLYPRKMEEVLWHSTTFRLVKSIFVKIPKLPTIRVIGSHDISTILAGFEVVSVAELVAVSILLIQLRRFVSRILVSLRDAVSVQFSDCRNAQVDIRSLIRNARAAIEVPCSRCAG
jgi:hypothetical protein